MSGTVRDVEYGKRVEKYLKEKGKEKERGEDGEPWMLAVNLVNPHDIVLLQALAWWGFVGIGGGSILFFFLTFFKYKHK